VQNQACRHLLKTETPKFMSYWTLGLLGGLSLSGIRQATAQVQAGPPLWPQVPALLGGGGPREIVAAIHRRLVYPPEARMACITGRVFVAFDIAPSGGVQRVKVVKPLWAPFDSAAVQAVRQLRFRPRPPHQAEVHYVVPINYQI
jgi:TonB family protein